MLIFSHNKFSQGAKKLAEELGCRCIKHEDSRFRGLRSPWVVNWGYSGPTLPWMERVRLLNAPEAVQRVANKLTFFEDMNDELIPLFSHIVENAQIMIERGHKVVCRTLLNASGGRGIVIASTVDELVDAPLYVQYIPKKAEYRVHIIRDRIANPHPDRHFYRVFDCQKKVKKQGEEPLNWQIRSHDNGFIFQREGIDLCPHKVYAVAINAISLTDLDFGAVDVIYNERQDRAYVLEINTAPGLEGQTVQSYARAIREYIEGHRGQ